MIDPNEETLAPLSKATAWVPATRSERVSPSTLWRWAHRGIGGVKLEVLRVGGTTCTSKEALGRFFVRLTHGEQPARSRKLERAHRTAEKHLATIGI